MAIETLHDIASELADSYGIYGSPTRCEWEAQLVDRMREAARVETVLAADAVVRIALPTSEEPK